MEVKEVLFMSKGDGESSYVQNSSYTQKVAAMSKPALERVVKSLFNDFLPHNVLNVVDLGCSSGPNTFSVMETVIESVKAKCGELNCQMPEFQFFLNDLPGNDFNTLFQGLSNFNERYKDVPHFVMGVPGSFHGRLFPSNSLHLVHSSYGVHWLSKWPRLTDKDGLPVNKGKIYISKTSPPAVMEAYLAQFQEDFDLFLKLRSQEMIHDGRAILVLHGRQSADPTTEEACFLWETLSEAIADMVSLEVKDVVDREGSFGVELLETFAIEDGDKGEWNTGEKLANKIRSFTESMISHQFGPEILDKLYGKLAQIVTQYLATRAEPHKTISIIVVLRRISVF